MNNKKKTPNRVNTITNKTFLDLYPVNLSVFESLSVQTLSISVRVKNVLIQKGVKTIADLYRMNVDEFNNLPGVGTRCYNELCKYLSEISNDNDVDRLLSKMDSKHIIPAIIIKNRDRVINNDFSFCKNLDIESEDFFNIENYKKAIEVLGPDLVHT